MTTGQTQVRPDLKTIKLTNHMIRSSIYLYLLILINIFIYIYTCDYIPIYTHILQYQYIYIYIYKYIYTCIYTHINTYIYVYIYIYNSISHLINMNMHKCEVRGSNVLCWQVRQLQHAGC
jgi:hypothetical protein